MKDKDEAREQTAADTYTAIKLFDSKTRQYPPPRVQGPLILRVDPYRGPQTSLPVHPASLQSANGNVSGTIETPVVNSKSFFGRNGHVSSLFDDG